MANRVYGWMDGFLTRKTLWVNGSMIGRSDGLDRAAIHSPIASHPPNHPRARIQSAIRAMLRNFLKSIAHRLWPVGRVIQGRSRNHFHYHPPMGKRERFIRTNHMRGTVKGIDRKRKAESSTKSFALYTKLIRVKNSKN